MNTSELRKGNYVEEEVLGLCKVVSILKEGKVEVEVVNMKEDKTTEKVIYTVHISNLTKINFIFN